MLLIESSLEVLNALLTMMIQWEQDTRFLPDNFMQVLDLFNRHLAANSNLHPGINFRDFLQQLKLFTLDELGFEMGQPIGSLKVINKDGYIDPEIKFWHENNCLPKLIEQSVSKSSK
ncbi:hypothetical protein Q5O14_17455 [Eubacteriaceae bacterium ES2]|nr:hypothetical protein Q5O14_17455 [Eubacteriaceae bacterium ES2]